MEESSTSRVVREPGVPLKSEAGRKRSLVLLARKRALSSSRPEVAMSGPSVGSIGLPLPSALSCRGSIGGDDDAGERVEEPPVTASVVSSKLDPKRVETVSPAGSRSPR